MWIRLAGLKSTGMTSANAQSRGGGGGRLEEGWGREGEEARGHS